MTNDKYDSEAELKAAKRAEIERLWFNQEATNKELLEAYKALDVKKEGSLIIELKTVKQELPIYWASYIANGDASGLEDDQEQELIDETLKQLNLTNCVDVLEDISFKTGISYLPNLLGGDYCTYVFLEPN